VLLLSSILLGTHSRAVWMMNTKMYGRVDPPSKPVKAGSKEGRTTAWMYTLMLVFLVVEAVILAVEKYQVSDDVLQGNYVLLDQGADADAPLEYIYQFPLLSNLDASVGVLFLAHGCSHAATDFWPRHELTCPKCRGLPVEKAVVVEALTRDYIVVAASAKDTNTGCWGAADLSRATRVIETIRENLNLPANIPNFLLGASSGGAFVASLGVHMNEKALMHKQSHLSVSGINVQVSPIPRQHWKKHTLEFMPSVHFVHMSRDTRTTALISDFLVEARAADVVVVEDVGAEGTSAKLSEEDQETAWFQEYNAQLESKAKALPDTDKDTGKATHKTMLWSTALPLPVTAELLVDRAYKVVPSLKVAERLVQAFKENKVIDEQGMLLSDPRSNYINWRDTVWRAIPEALKQTGDTLVADQSAISEILNVAYGQHEFTDMFLATTFDFFDVVSPFAMPTDVDVGESVDSLFGF